MRKFIIAGNWKMNKTVDETKKFINEFHNLIEENLNCEIVLCIPFTSLCVTSNILKNKNVKIGAQNCHFKSEGAFTGEISAKMLKELNVNYVIIGHSERRQFFSETNETVNLRLKAALKFGLKAIVCVGETLTEREHNTTSEVVAMQVKWAMHGLTSDEAQNVIIAYEPVWAIGTGKVATSDEAQYVCKLIRKTIENLFNLNVAQNLVIQYGGSMNETNCEDLLKKPDIDGGLIGGASLDAAKFARIVKIACQINK